MKKKSICIVSGLCLLIVLGASFSFPSLATKDEVHELIRKSGEIEKIASTKQAVLLMKGKTISVDSNEVFLLAEKYKLSGIEDASEKALRFLLERKALYRAAVEAGYSTTRAEAQEIVNHMKESFHEAKNFNDFLEYLDGAGMTEEEYWVKQVDIVAKENTMAEFANAQRAQLKASQNLDDEQTEKIWLDKRKAIINQQIKADNVTVVNEIKSISVP